MLALNPRITPSKRNILRVYPPPTKRHRYEGQIWGGLHKHKLGEGT